MEKTGFIRLTLLIYEYSFQLHFWSLWSKSASRTDSFNKSSLEARELFSEAVSYLQGKTGSGVDFTRYTFRPLEYKTSYFTKLDRQVEDLAADATPDMLVYITRFMQIYNILRHRVGSN